jgi:2-haloacid dehalogenase
VLEAGGHRHRQCGKFLAMPPSNPPGHADAVVFDLGGVLLDWDPRHLYRKLFDDSTEMDWFLSQICTLEWHADHDRGVPTQESCARLASVYPDYAELILAWGQRTEEMVAGPIEGTVEIVRELRRASVPCFALTNMEAETYPKRVARYPFLSWFEGTVVSSFEGVAKPDPEIFRRLLERFELEPETTVMIDDSPLNLETAGSFGMTAILFRSPEQLRHALGELGLLSPGPG